MNKSFTHLFDAEIIITTTQVEQLYLGKVGAITREKGSGEEGEIL